MARVSRTSVHVEFVLDNKNGDVGITNERSGNKETETRQMPEGKVFIIYTISVSDNLLQIAQWKKC